MSLDLLAQFCDQLHLSVTREGALRSPGTPIEIPMPDGPEWTNSSTPVLALDNILHACIIADLSFEEFQSRMSELACRNHDEWRRAFLEIQITKATTIAFFGGAAALSQIIAIHCD